MSNDWNVWKSRIGSHINHAPNCHFGHGEESRECAERDEPSISLASWRGFIPKPRQLATPCGAFFEGQVGLFRLNDAAKMRNHSLKIQLFNAQDEGHKTLHTRMITEGKDKETIYKNEKMSKLPVHAKLAVQLFLLTISVLSHFMIFSLKNFFSLSF